jgi:two-component system chemotaxis sensor kinase CheA
MSDDEFVREARESVRRLSGGLVELERGADRETVDDLFRHAHGLKGLLAMRGYDEASDLAHAIEDLLDAVRAGRLDPDGEPIDRALAGVDALAEALADVAREGRVDADLAPVTARIRAAAGVDADADPVGESADGSTDAGSGGDVAPDRGEPVTDDAGGHSDNDVQLGGADDGTDVDVGGDAGADSDADANADADGPAGVSVTPEVAADVDVGDDFDDDGADGLMSAEEALDAASEFDDLESLVEDVDDADEFADLEGGGSFADVADPDPDPAGGGETGGAASDAGSDPAAATESEPGSEPADPAATFADMRASVDRADTATLQRELESVEFGEFDEEDDLTIDELLAGESDAADDVDLDRWTVEAPADDPDAETEPQTRASAEGFAGTGFRSAVETDPTDTAGASGATPDAASAGSDDAGGPDAAPDGTATASDDALERVLDVLTDSGGPSDGPDADPAGPTTRPSATPTEGAGGSPGTAHPSSDADTDAPGTTGAAGSMAGGGGDPTADSASGPSVTDAGSDGPRATDDGTSAGEAVSGDSSPESRADPTGSATPDVTEGGDAVDPDLDVDVDVDVDMDMDMEMGADTDMDMEMDMDLPGDPDPRAEADAAAARPNTADVDLDAEGFQRDAATEAFEARFADAVGGDDDADEQPTARPVTTIADSSFGGGTARDRGGDGDGDASPGATDAAPAGTTTPDPGSLSVDVDTAERLLRLVEDVAVERLALRDELSAAGVDLPTGAADRFDALAARTDDLRRAVMDVRLQPLSSVTDRLPRVARDAARREDKDVAVDVEGADVKLDRDVIARAGDALGHLVRNAVSHGIESPDARTAADKPATGTVTVRARRDGDDVVIEVTDDGRGIEVEEVRERAIEAGLVTAAEAAELSRSETYDLLFRAGFTTAEEVTGVSGRGVGLDAVGDAVSALDGSVELKSTPGEGTTVRLRLPVTVAMAEVLFVTVGDETYALPTAVVEGVDRLGAFTSSTSRRRAVADGGRPGDGDGTGTAPDGRTSPPRRTDDGAPVVDLREAFDVPGPAPPAGERFGVRVVGREGPRVLAVDAVGRRREAVVDPFDDLLSDTPGVSGTTVSTDGHIVNVIDIDSL